MLIVKTESDSRDAFVNGFSVGTISYFTSGSSNE